MVSTVLDVGALTATLERLRARIHVVGAQVAVDRAGDIAEAAAGILNVELRGAVTTDVLGEMWMPARLVEVDGAQFRHISDRMHGRIA
jgi:hypothetical protein